MPAESVALRVSQLAVGRDQEHMKALLAAVVDALQALTAKLDADGGVIDTNYAATIAAIVTD